MNTDYTCRVCETTENLEIIFKKENKGILAMFKVIANVSIEPDDALPKCLCVSCMKQLEQAHEFKIQCEETDRKWRERLSHKVTNKNNTTRQEQDNYEYEEARFIYDYSKDNRESVFIKKEEIFEPECHLEDTEILQNSSSSEKEDDPNSGDEAPDAQSSFSDTPAKKEISEDVAPKPSKRGRPKSTSKPALKLLTPRPKGRPKGSTKAKMAKQRAMLQPGEDKVYQCHICQKVLTKRGLGVHMETHGERHVCQLCGKQYSQRTGLNRHIRHFHNQQRPHECELCGKRFPRVSALQLHAATHRSERRFKCEICERTFKTTHCLNIHRKVHGDGSKLMCNICGQTFTDTPTQLAHMRKHRDFQCSVCSKRFVCEESMRIHEARHVNEKMHPCDFCSQTFRRICDLNQHKLIHPESRPYECSVCGKTYRHRGGLYMHTLVHTGGMEFRCELCPKKFMKKYSLTKHILKHEAEAAESEAERIKQENEAEAMENEPDSFDMELDQVKLNSLDGLLNGQNDEVGVMN